MAFIQKANAPPEVQREYYPFSDPLLLCGFSFISLSPQSQQTCSPNWQTVSKFDQPQREIEFLVRSCSCTERKNTFFV